MNVPSDPRSLQSYVADFEPIPENIPLVHVVPNRSLPELLDSREIRPTANSRVNRITRKDDGSLVDGHGNPLPDTTANRLQGTDIAEELNQPMVHFSLGVPYYRPSFSSNKKGLEGLYPCALIFDPNDVATDYIYGNDTGSFVMNFQHGHDADPATKAQRDRGEIPSGNVPADVTVQGMKLDSMEGARRYIRALFGSADAYLRGTTTNTKPPAGDHTHARFIDNMLRNPMTGTFDAKDASVSVEVKTAAPVGVDKIKGIVMPEKMLGDPTVQAFLKAHPRVAYRTYATTPWIEPDHYQVSMAEKAQELYRDLGFIGQDVEDPKIAAARAEIDSARWAHRPPASYALRVTHSNTGSHTRQ